MILFGVCQTAAADETYPADGLWEKTGANFGIFMSCINSSFRIGSGIGLEVNVEKLLDLDSTATVFRTEAQ